MAIRMTRRDLLRWGIVLGGGAVLSSGQRVSRADDWPPSPRTTRFKNELKTGQGIPPPATKVAPFTTSRDVPIGTEFFVIEERPVSHEFHPQGAALGENVFENVLWGYDGMIPGPTIIAKSGTPQLVRFINNLVEDGGIGEPISAIHRHGDGWH